MMLDAFWVLLTRFVQRGANLLVLMMLARALTPVELGFYGYVVSTSLVLTVAFDLGLRQGAAAALGKAPERAGPLTSQLVLLWCGLAALASSAAWAMMAWGGLAEAGPAAMALAVLAIAPMLLVRMGQGIFLGTGELRRLNQSELVSRAILLVLTLLLWWRDLLDLDAALALMALSQLASAAYVLVALRRGLAWRHFGEWSAAGELLRQGWGFFGAILLMILSGRIGVWAVGWLASPAETGSYFAVLRLAEMLVEVATAVGVVVFSRGVRAGRDREAAVASAGVARLVTFVMACAALAAGAMAGPVLTVVMGDGFGHAAGALRWMLGGAVASCLVMILYPALSSRGHARSGVWLFGAAVAVNGLLALALVPPLGLDGAAMAFAGGQATAALAILFVYRRSCGLDWRELLLPRRQDFAWIGKLLRRRSGGLPRAA
ncbi:MAG TPA: lipopolysaccharide biosynthesis protein [Geminicoccaceae bacterium]|nr:lipopolysaccharide biosynthesis protein [Geminicoccus sp.]HMU51612.1 lipopolysaccharide biosynthesis protein [Geminicoccaceae bacterium]